MSDTLVYSTASKDTPTLKVAIAKPDPDKRAKIRRPRVAKWQPRLSDGNTYPVTVTRI